MPDFPIIDAHIHLYDPRAVDYGWMTGDALLDKRHLPADLDERRGNVSVDGFVFVEVVADAGQEHREAEWIEAIVGQDSRLLGTVVSAPVEKGVAVDDDLEALRRLPHLKGIRRLLENHADEPGWITRHNVIEGVRRLAKFDLPFDLCIFARQLRETIELVRSCPEVHFVLDHIGKPDIRHGFYQPWASELSELAREPNICCKISGVATEAHHHDWSEDDLRRYISDAIDAFGFDRVMFGGDWPVSERAIAYDRWVELVDQICVGSSREELEKLYRRNAIAFYELGGAGT